MCSIYFSLIAPMSKGVFLGIGNSTKEPKVLFNTPGGAKILVALIAREYKR